MNTKITQIEKDIRATIRLLRFLTHGEGSATITVFDGGAGGGFDFGEVTIYLERSGLNILKAQEYTPKDFSTLLSQLLWPYNMDMTKEELLDSYKKKKWDE